MDSKLFSRYPSIEDLRQKARRRIPHFAWEYLDSGTGIEDCLRRNRQAFSDVLMKPRFMQGEFEPDVSTQLLGQDYSAPIGMSPVGLTGLMWPGIEKMLAQTAARQRIPYTLSTAATESIETIAPLCKDMGWFNLYPPRQETIRKDILARADAAGYKTLVVTVDVPIGSRRERQIRAGVTVPPKITPRMLYHCSIRPTWSLSTLRYGQPRFRTLETYLDSKDMQHMVSFIGQELSGSFDWKYLEQLRSEWPGQLMLKGVLEPEQARQSVELGCDAVWVSNHGGRQFDGAETSLSVLPEIRSAIPKETPIVFDSGVRTGLDVARALALGADFVMLGRAFLYGGCALGSRGIDHAYHILVEDLKNNMIQLGCRTADELGSRLVKKA